LAIENIKKAISINPTCEAYYNNLGEIYANYLGKYDLAIETILKAISINPDYALAYGTLGYIYYLKKDYVLAIINFNKALSMNIKYPVIKEYLKSAIEESGKNK
jgi:tetratricopeptide (TPR) repeat protein